MAQHEFRILADVHIEPLVVEQLRQRSVHIQTVAELLGQDAQDPDILDYAFMHTYTLLTHDKHITDHVNDRFAADKEHCGVFIVSHHLHGNQGIGVVVDELFFWHKAIEGDAATLHEDVYNQIKWIT